MFIKSTATALLAFAVNQVVAQTATPSQVALVEANMEQAGLIPGLLEADDVQLEGILNIAFGSSTVSPGQPIAQPDAQTFPTVSVDRLASSNDTNDQVYTAMLVDADIVGTDNQNGNQTFHWLANGCTIGDDGNLDLTAANTAIDYVGPGPAEGSGPHRYVMLLVAQESDFDAPEGITFGARSLSDYLDNDGLGDVVAANFFTVEQGTATGEIPATTSVDPATVVVAATTATTTEGSSTLSATVTSTGANTMGTAASTTLGAGAASSSSATPPPPANAAMAVKATGAWTVGAALVGAAAGALLI